MTRMESTAGLVVRRIPVEEIGIVHDLMAQTFGERSVLTTEPFLRWKHWENVFGPSPVLVAEADGRVVAFRTFMRWALRVGGHPVRAVRAVDTATHPDYRGQGLFRRLTLQLRDEMEHEGVALVFNTPNEQSRPGYLKMGWSSVGRTDLWVRPLRPLDIVRAVARRGGGAPPRPVPADAFPEAQALCARAELSRLLDEEALATETEARMATTRTPEYLRWRYAAIPGFRYHALLDFDGSDGAAVVFRYKEQGTLLELRICELIVGRGTRSLRMARALVERVCKEGRAHYVSVMAAASTPERRVVLRSGFLPAFRFGPILTVRPLQPSGNLVVDPQRRASWRLSIGDLELF
jgi:GNAT superfamily N-acetyltransferase